MIFPSTTASNSVGFQKYSYLPFTLKLQFNTPKHKHSNYLDQPRNARAPKTKTEQLCSPTQEPEKQDVINIMIRCSLY